MTLVAAITVRSVSSTIKETGYPGKNKPYNNPITKTEIIKNVILLPTIYFSQPHIVTAAIIGASSQIITYNSYLKLKSSEVLKNSKLYGLLSKPGNLSISKKKNSPITPNILKNLEEYASESINLKNNLIPNIAGLNSGKIAFIANFYNRSFNPNSEENLLKHIKKIAYKSQKDRE